MIQDARRLFLTFVLVVSVMYITDGFAAFGHYFSDFLKAGDAFFRVYSKEVQIILLVSIFLGLSLGRVFCGWLCPLAAIFNFLAPLCRRRSRLDKRLKYAVLALVALLVYDLAIYGTSFLSLQVGKYIALGGLSLIVLSSLAYGRVFCTSLCPVGAWFSLLGKLAVFRLRIGEECTTCERCNRVCEMRLDVAHGRDLHECSLCWACVEECPYKAIKLRFILS
ncbi:4Fe-4S binding protein [Candidatus Pyrohabitans sp.]